MAKMFVARLDEHAAVDVVLTAAQIARLESVSRTSGRPLRRDDVGQSLTRSVGSAHSQRGNVSV